MPQTRFIDLSPTITVDTDAYTAGDVVGGLLTMPIKAAAGGGILNSVLLVDGDGVGADLTLYVFRAAPTSFADDAAFAPTAADLQALVAIVKLGTSTSINSTSVYHVPDVNQAFRADALYGYLVAAGTPTYTNADALSLRLSVVSD